MKQIVYSAGHFDVHEGPEGTSTKVLMFTEAPNGPAHFFNLPEEVAYQLGCDLKGEEAVIQPTKPQLLVPNASA